jgi:hypothetical protein
MKTRAEIDVELARLARVLPKLIDECEPDDVLEAFAAESEIMTEVAGPDDAAYVQDRIQCLLLSAGLIPGVNEGESCA